MTKMSEQKRYVTKSIELSAGLFVVRYTDAMDQVNPPTIVLTGHPASSVEIVYEPHIVDGGLRIGSVAVLRVSEASSVLVTTIAGLLSISSDVTVEIEPLGRPALNDLTVKPMTPVCPVRDGDELILTGYVTSRGLCGVDASGWLGSNSASSRLEGFSLAWKKPIAGVLLSYGCELDNGQSIRSRVAGSFVGLLGEGLGIEAIRFQIRGPQAAENELVVSAIFNGHGPQTQSGQIIDMRKPSHGTVLRALKVAIRALEPAGAPSQANSKKVPVRRKVFRSK